MLRLTKKINILTPNAQSRQRHDFTTAQIRLQMHTLLYLPFPQGGIHPLKLFDTPQHRPPLEVLRVLHVPRNPPVTVIRMMHITITSFDIDLHANKSYLQY